MDLINIDHIYVILKGMLSCSYNNCIHAPCKMLTSLRIVFRKLSIQYIQGTYLHSKDLLCSLVKKTNHRRV